MHRVATGESGWAQGVCPGAQRGLKRSQGPLRLSPLDATGVRG